jgi:hypothetical protein
LVAAACGAGTPAAGPDGRVDATPRALAAVVIEHVDPGTPRRTTGHWSDRNDPLAIEAQVDYGVDPEGTESGSSHTVHVDVMEKDGFSADDRRWLRCRPAHEEGRCEESSVDGVRLLFRWRPGMAEEEGGSYSWTVVRKGEVVQVGYDESGLFDRDPRELELPVEPSDLREAALDPAMSLRTTPAFLAAGRELDHYEGVESPPEEPTIVRTTPRQLAARTLDYLGLEPTSVRRSRLTDFGPDAVGVHLGFPAGKGYDAFTLDVLTTVGRVPQIDPLPCRVQRSRTAARDSCFAWDADTAATWTLASEGRPGRMWIIGAQDDDRFDRVESVGVLVSSTGIDVPPFASVQVAPRIPDDVYGLGPFTSDLSVGPERRLAD